MIACLMVIITALNKEDRCMINMNKQETKKEAAFLTREALRCGLDLWDELHKEDKAALAALNVSDSIYIKDKKTAQMVEALEKAKDELLKKMEQLAEISDFLDELDISKF